MGQIGMIALGIDQKQFIAVIGKREIEVFNGRLFRLAEIDRHKTTDRDSHLVKKPARLAKIDVFGKHADLGSFDRIDLVFVVEAVEDLHQHHFEAGGRRNARTDENPGIT